MHPTAPSASPAQLFEQAKRDFAAGDFENARARARKADVLVTKQAEVTNCDPVESPIYSIIVVTYRDTADVAEALSRLSPYSRDEKFEIIIVNNGNPAAAGLSSSSFSHYKFIEVGFNYGCSGARNLGARTARGDFLIFVDDDGFIDEGAVENLIEVMKKHDAVMVRGRVVPKLQSGIAAEHYDLGDDITVAGPNAECLLICPRDEYLEHGGFDTLLAGHEGWALCSKMYPSHGPESFLYAPQAIIRHDYANDPKHEAEKRNKFNANDDYLGEYYPLAVKLRISFRNPEAGAVKKLVELIDIEREYLRSARKVERLEKAHRQIKTSTSWRITAPLRKVAKILRIGVKRDSGVSSPR